MVHQLLVGDAMSIGTSRVLAGALHAWLHHVLRSHLRHWAVLASARRAGGPARMQVLGACVVRWAACLLFRALLRWRESALGAQQQQQLKMARLAAARQRGRAKAVSLQPLGRRFGASTVGRRAQV